MSGCIHHVSLTCQSPLISQTFYQQFGFTVEKQYEDETVSITLMAANNGARIELFHFKSGLQTTSENHKKTSELPSLQQMGITHFALAVDDIEKYHRRFSKNGTCTEIKQARLGHFVYFFTVDPDGNQIEVIMEKK